MQTEPLTLEKSESSFFQHPIFFVLCVILLNFFWVLKNLESPSYDEACYLYLALKYLHGLQSHEVILSIKSFMTVLGFKVPMITWQAMPFFLIFKDPKWVIFFSQSCWLITTIYSLKILCPDPSNKKESNHFWIFPFLFIWFSPFFTAQYRQFHQDLPTACLTLLSFAFFKQYQDSKNLNFLILSSLITAIAQLMRIEFLCNVLGIPFLLLFTNGKPLTMKLRYSLGYLLPSFIVLAGIAAFDFQSFRFLLNGGLTVSNGEHYTLELFLKSRLLLISHFMFFGLGCALLLFPAWIKELYNSKDTKKKFLSNHTLLLSSLLTLLFHLLTNHVTASDGEPRSRMLLAPAALFIAGIFSQNFLMHRKTLFLSSIGAFVFCAYMSFFHSYDGITAPTIYTRVAVPRKAMFEKVEPQIIDYIVHHPAQDKPKTLIMIDTTNELTEVSFALYAETAKAPVISSTDLFTEVAKLQETYDMFDYMLLPAGAYLLSNQTEQKQVRYQAKEQYVKSHSFKLVANFALSNHSYEFALYQRQKPI